MDTLTNLLACVGKPIYLLSIVVHTNVIPTHFAGFTEMYELGYTHGELVAITVESKTNHIAVLTFGSSNIETIWSLPAKMYSSSYPDWQMETGTVQFSIGVRTNFIPMFTNYINLP